MYPRFPHTRTASRAARLTFAAVALAAAVIATPADAEATTVADTSNISVTHTAAPSPDEGCVPRAFGLTRDIIDTAGTFTLQITAAQRLCDPVDVTAVIYEMPGNGVAWPQTRVERHTFNVGAAGTYTVRFTKTCRPAQFDVVVGATPEVIAPWGEHHGPLLFTFDTATALQHWGTGCIAQVPDPVPSTTVPAVPETTTTAPTGPAPTTAPPVSTPTVPADEPTTTIGAPTDTVAGPTGTPDVDEPGPELSVAGITQPRPGTLAHTGGDLSLAGLGWSLLAAGCVALALRNRPQS